MKHTLRILSIITLFFLMSCEGKITDPKDPQFDPMKFDFNDYRDHDQLLEHFKVMFPPGTPMERVDQVLVGAGKAYRQVHGEDQH